MQMEDQLALLHALPRVAHRCPRATVPNDHFACAVLFGRDGALEAAVRDRVILDMDRHTFVGRIEARSLRHRPGEQHTVELEPKVVVQACCRVLLHDEREFL